LVGRIVAAGNLLQDENFECAMHRNWILLVVQTSHVLMQLLVGIRMEEWVDLLANLGVTEVPDLHELMDEEFYATGMRLVPLRKLRATAGPPAPEARIPVQFAALPMSYGDNTKDPQRRPTRRPGW
jgi:hypothetical protein